MCKMWRKISKERFGPEPNDIRYINAPELDTCVLICYKNRRSEWIVSLGTPRLKHTGEYIVEYVFYTNDPDRDDHVSFDEALWMPLPDPPQD